MNAHIKTGASVLRKHLPSILTGIACAGVVITGYLTHKATEKTVREILTYEGTDIKLNGHFTKRDLKNYIPPAIAAVGTIACIIGANKIHLSREAAMAAAVAFYKAAGEEFEDAVFDKFNDAGLKENVLNENNQPLTGNMKIRIWEPYTKQYFEATQQEILWAELTVNKMLHQGGTVTLNDVLKLYSDPKIKHKEYGDMIGWSWDDDSFQELSCYYYAGGWIDMCPQFEDTGGTPRFVMEYGIYPNDITEQK